MNANNLQIIFTADDFGIKESYNEAILKGFNEGYLTATCVCSNGEAFFHAISLLDKFNKNGKKIDLGIHFDLIEGHSLTNSKLLTDKNGKFNNGFISLFLKSFNKNFQNEIEREFTAQIEHAIEHIKTKNYEISFINSHVHTHAIPNIFKITKKISEKYNINFIRTQKEMPYISGDLPKIINLIKLVVLWVFNLFNHHKHTNKNMIGVLYTNEMTTIRILDGLKNKTGIIEVLTHPDLDLKNVSRYRQFEATLDKRLNIYRDNFKSLTEIDSWD